MQGVKRYADYETIIAESISRSLGVVPISQCRYRLLLDQNLDFFSYIELCWVGFGWVWLPENYCPLFRRPYSVESI